MVCIIYLILQNFAVLVLQLIFALKPFVRSFFSLTCDLKILLNLLKPVNEKQVLFLQNCKLLIKYVRVGKVKLVFIVIVG